MKRRRTSDGESPDGTPFALFDHVPHFDYRMSHLRATTMIKVLCIDDHEDAADSTAQLLRLAGFEARACLGPEQAMREVATFAPDVCVIDLAMPGMAGDVLAEKLREATGRPLRCIALTGSWDIDAQHRTNNAGFEAHLVKPVDPAKLVAAVRGA